MNLEKLKNELERLKKQGEIDPDQRIEFLELAEEFQSAIQALVEELALIPDKEPEDGKPFISDTEEELDERLKKVEIAIEKR